MSGPFWSQPLQAWDEMFQAGVRAHYAATVLATPLLRPGGLVVTISFFPGSYLNGDDQVAYSVAKAADDRMVAVMAAQLRECDVTAVALYPGLVRTEGVLRAADFFDLSDSESPEFVGRAVAALAADPGVARFSGQSLVAAELAVEYGFTDIGGTTTRQRSRSILPARLRLTDTNRKRPLWASAHVGVVGRLRSAPKSRSPGQGLVSPVRQRPHSTLLGMLAELFGSGSERDSIAVRSRTA